VSEPPCRSYPYLLSEPRSASYPSLMSEPGRMRYPDFKSEPQLASYPSTRSAYRFVAGRPLQVPSSMPVGVQASGHRREGE
jgi:hypothetical protein